MKHLRDALTVSAARQLATKVRKLEAENKRLRRALEPMTKGTFWLSGTDVRRAYKVLGINWRNDGL